VGRGPEVLTQERSGRPASLAPDSATAWRWIGWFGLLLFVAGLGDFVIAWVPMRLGSPEWEFGTVASTLAGLPLATMGLAGLLGSAVARGKRGMTRAVAAVVLVWGAVVLGSYGDPTVESDFFAQGRTITVLAYDKIGLAFFLHNDVVQVLLIFNPGGLQHLIANC